MSSRSEDFTQNFLFVLEPKAAYRHIRNYLAGRFVGATRDETLLHEVVKALLCKLYLMRAAASAEKTLRSNGTALFVDYQKAFKKVRALLPATFERSEEIVLDADSIDYIDRLLDQADIRSATRDPIGDLYEAFIGSSARGQDGQFFTPQNAVSLLVSLVNPRADEQIIDPACGSGGFLSATARTLISQGASSKQIAQNLFGVDKDQYLVGLASAHIFVATLGPANIYCADSLKWSGEVGQPFPLKKRLGTFDVVLTNPPFGSRIIAASREMQRTFELGYRWIRNSKTHEIHRTSTLQSNVPPQVLFVERCLSLVRPGGRIGIVVPESLICSSNHRYVVRYIRQHSAVRAVIGMPENLFKTSGKGGTHTKTCLLFLEKKKSEANSSRGRIFLAEAKWCGRDSRGSAIQFDDLPKIEERFRQASKAKLDVEDHLGYQISTTELIDDVLAPRYYNPDVKSELSSLVDTHDLVKFGDLVSSGLIEITTGDEVGKLAYSTGSIPFVRTSDLSNWEIKVDPKHGLSEEVYEAYARKQDVRESDILMVRDGTYLIGTCAYITRYDTRIVYQSHLYKLRITDHLRLSPYLLLAILSSVPVQRQIKAKRFTQDIIDSLGNRILELLLPIPKNGALKDRVTDMVKKSIEDRVEARELARKACLDLIGVEEQTSHAARASV